MTNDTASGNVMALSMLYVKDILGTGVVDQFSGFQSAVASLYERKDDVVSIPLVEWTGHIVCVWVVGLLLGWMLPRPKVYSMSSGRIPFRLWCGRLAIVWNALLLVREVWYRFCRPGTFRGMIRTVVVSLHKGMSFRDAWRLVYKESRCRGQRKGCKALSSSSSSLDDFADPLQWYVSQSDLAHFKESVDTEEGGVWEKMFEKSWEGCSYVAWRRRRPNGRTEYKSVTVAENATCNEFMDFYLDDDTRPKWDGLISTHELLESAHSFDSRCQVVRWIRSFPFAFISDREYVIARRVFLGDTGEMYGITKSVEHPAAPHQQGIVRMQDFYSMWRSRTVPCPSGSGRPACETTLLHYEDFGIPENLARFAVRHGMGGFVSNMVPHMNAFVQERRTRCNPYETDPHAYGHSIRPKFPQCMRRQGSQGDISSTSAHGALSECEPSDGGLHRSKSVRSISCMVLATGIAWAVSRHGQSGHDPYKKKRHISHRRRNHRHLCSHMLHNEQCD